MVNVDKLTALRIINSLKDGVPSVDDIEYYSASKNSLDPVIAGDMYEISKGNYGKVKFINGGYGEGKTHFLSRIRSKAISDNYLVSMFAISPRGIALDMMERVFGELIKTIVVKDSSGNRIGGDAIEHVVSQWLPTAQDPKQVLRAMSHLDRDLRNALTSIAEFLPKRALYLDELEILIGWMLGDTHSKSDLKRKFKIFNHINPRNVFDIMKSFAKFFKAVGYNGWIILIDEQEIISTLLSSRRRELTDQNIRLLIDEQSKMDGLYIIFATTDEFFTDPIKGVVSYPALKTRVTQANTLYLPSIGKVEMEEIAHRLIDISGMAWDMRLNVDDQQLNECIKIALDYSIPSSKARTYIKSLIRLMEAVRTDEKADPVAVFGEIYPNTYHEVATERENAREDIGL